MKMHSLLLLVTALLFMGQLEAGMNDSTAYKAAEAALSAADYNRAYTLFQRVADAEQNPLAGFTLGLFHQNGWGRVRDLAAACRWFDKAAQGGIPYGQHLFGECLEKGTHQSADPVAAAHWYWQAALGGYVLSNCYLGRLYMNGQGVAKDPIKALELCHGAVKSSLLATVWMGRFYLQGDESIRDYAKATQWFEQATQYDLPQAHYYLGLMIEWGLIKTPIPQHARQMYERAAAQGHVAAYYPTGRLYFNASIVPALNRLSAHDLAKAYLWLSATRERSQEKEELAETDKMLQQVLAMMPESWLAELDRKLKQHLQDKRP